MVIVLKKDSSSIEREQLSAWLAEQTGAEPQLVESEGTGLIYVLGQTSCLDTAYLERLPMVQAAKRLSSPYRCSGRTARAENTVIRVGNAAIGGENFCVIAGPCSVESEEQILSIAAKVKTAGAKLLRGGAFKPRTSPYSFQGLGKEGIDLLVKAKKATCLPVVSEILSVRDLDLYDEVDVLQVGARNMQNFDLLKELAKVDKPILLKRGYGNTLKELLMSAEYLLSGGNSRVILCERGTRSFDSYARNALDLTGILSLHELSHLPVLVDPSHATGKARFVPPMSLAATAAGCDGLLIEVHDKPESALCDGAQAITPAILADLISKTKAIRSLI